MTHASNMKTVKPFLNKTWIERNPVLSGTIPKIPNFKDLY